MSYSNDEFASFELSARFKEFRAAIPENLLSPGLNRIDLEFEQDSVLGVTAEVIGVDRTGFEMEALVAASVAALTVYDMLKSVDKSIRVTDLRLLEKSGGKSGDWTRDHEK